MQSTDPAPKKRFKVKYIKRSLLLCLISLICFALYAPFFVYQRFNQETPIATLHFEKIDTHLYKAHLATGDFCDTHTFLLEGDQWQIDANFLKFTGPAVLLGFDSRYQLDRLSGRFKQVTDQNNTPPQAYDLKEDVWLNYFDTEPNTRDSAWLIDTVFGASVYLTIQPNVQYTVYKTEDGLIAKGELNELDLSDGNIITITKGCANRENVIEKIGKAFNRFLL